ncbi:MAG: hypothetical protein ABFD20_01255 [Anaerolineales bacterium]
MLIRQAKELARQWVREQQQRWPGYAGAFVHGSANWLADDADLAPTSDLDVMVVIDGPLPENRPGKFLYGGVLLEGSFLSREELRSPEQVLGCYHLAGSFHQPSVIDDPTGELTALNAAVAREYARRAWVERRCADAMARIERNLHGVPTAPIWPDQVTAWLFATGITCHVVLVAGLRNPTVRLRYVAAQELLHAYGRDDDYLHLLTLLGCAELNAAQVSAHVDALERVFEAAGAALHSPYPYAADLSADARPVAIDGSRALVAAGLHREAMFWIVATYSRCLNVLWRDAPVSVRAIYLPGYQRLLADLGITSPTDLARRCAALEAFLPDLWQLALALIAANPEISD